MNFNKNEGAYILGCLENAMEEALFYGWKTEYNEYWNVKDKYEQVCNEDMSCEYDFSYDELRSLASALSYGLEGLSEGDFEYIAIEKIIDKIHDKIERINRSWR